LIGRGRGQLKIRGARGCDSGNQSESEQQAPRQVHVHRGK